MGLGLVRSVVMTPAEAIQHLTDNFRPEQQSQPVMVRRDLVYRIVADDGQSLSGGGLGHWQMSGSRKDPFNLLIKSQRYRGKNKPAIPLGRKVKLLYRAGTSDATHLAFAGEPVAVDVRQTFVLGKRARSVHLEGPLQQAAMMSIFKKTNTFQFSLVVADVPPPTPPPRRASPRLSSRTSSHGSSRGSSSGSPSGSTD